MSETLDLFGPVIQTGSSIVPRARKSDPVTSHQAASQATFAGEHCRRILEALAVAPGTIYELADAVGLDHVQVARRCADLERDGKAVPMEHLRPGPTGRMCRVWRLA